MVMTERAKLLATFQAKKASGLKDMKFFLGSTPEMTVEDVCAEVNHWFDEAAKGNVTKVTSWGDTRKSSSAAA